MFEKMEKEENEMENKAMTMDQLDQVAGGYHAETAVLA
jgi:hypothetical protein